MDAQHDDEQTVGELARLLPAPSVRHLPAGRGHTLKEHLMTEIRQETSTATRRRSRRRVLVVRAGTGAAGLAAAALALSALAGSGPSAPHLGGGAVVLLAKVADAAARQPSPVVRDDQFAYVALEQAFATVTFNGDQYHTTLPSLAKRQIWRSVSDLCRTGLLRDPHVPGKAGDGTPLGPYPGEKCPDTGSLNDPTYRLLRTLPTSPRKLLDLIYATEKGHGPGPDQEAFTTIGDLLRESIAPPAVSAALYRAAALIPGVTMIGDATDAIGRHGLAVASGGEQWIFDRTTLRLLGERDTDPSTGKLIGETAILARGFVDRPGQIPGNG